MAVSMVRSGMGGGPMKLILGAAHCAIAAGCLAVLWAVFRFATDSPWGIVLLGVWIVLMVVAIWRAPPERR